MLNGEVPPAMTRTERELERMQKRVAEGQLAEAHRRRLIADLYEAGMSQVEIAARCTRAAQAVGGKAVGVDGIQKILKRMRVSRP